jgi:four helix bundle protein
MGAQCYQELVCWQLARDLRVRVREITAKPMVARDFGFCDDIKRSARSGPANIAEGFRRRRPKQFAQFLNVALASIDETENHLGEALEASYIDELEHKELVVLVKRARIASQRLLTYLERWAQQPENLKPWKRPNPRTGEPRKPADRENLNPLTRNP